jgi:hypothetical protein
VYSREGCWYGHVVVSGVQICDKVGVLNDERVQRNGGEECLRNNNSDIDGGRLRYLNSSAMQEGVSPGCTNDRIVGAMR